MAVESRSESDDPFRTLGLPAEFALDPEVLDARYRELQRALHPDRHASAPPAERRMNLERAVQVNDAYRVMRDEITRAEALLKLHGISTRESNAPAALLMDILEQREELAEKKAEKDLAGVNALVSRISEAEADTRKKLATAFAEGNYALAHSAWTSMRYYRRFQEEAESILEQD